MLPAVSAFGHDPLNDKHEHRVEPRTHPVERVNLADIRARVVTFRETGDDRHLDEAWRLLAPALAKTSPDFETLIVASIVAQSRHEFDFAIKLIRKSLSINSDNDEGWLLLASIQLVLGEADAAAAACGQLRNSPPLVLLTCKARVALVTGAQEDVFEKLHGILHLSNADRLPADILAWSYSVAGDLAVAAGKMGRAAELYRHSLTLAERTQVRAALLDVFLLRSEYDAAERVLRDGSFALPLLVRRLIVAKRRGRLHELQPALARVQHEFEEWIANEDWLHAREMARFYLDVMDAPVRARRLALINIALQQEPEDQRLDERTQRRLLGSTGAANAGFSNSE